MIVWGKRKWLRNAYVLYHKGTKGGVMKDEFLLYDDGEWEQIRAQGERRLHAMSWWWMRTLSSVATP